VRIGYIEYTACTGDIYRADGALQHEHLPQTAEHITYMQEDLGHRQIDSLLEVNAEDESHAIGSGQEVHLRILAQRELAGLQRGSSLEQVR